MQEEKYNFEEAEGRNMPSYETKGPVTDKNRDSWYPYKSVKPVDWNFNNGRRL